MIENIQNEDIQKEKIQEVIVLEGRHDTAAIRRAMNADTIETGGSALDKETVEQIRRVHATRGVIVFTDPDYPGQRLRQIIQDAIPDCKHAFISINQARSGKGKVGVEHAHPQDLVRAIKQAKASVITDRKLKGDTDITDSMLLSYQCAGGPGSRELRAQIGQYLGIGYANAKQFKRRLMMFDITQKQFIQAYEYVTQETKR